jgi:hypothetical protein
MNFFITHTYNKRMDFFITHTFGKRLNVNYLVLPKWWVIDNPLSMRGFVMFKSDIAVDWVVSYSSLK